MGTDVLCVKDMAGLLTPYVGYELIRRLKGRIKLPIHLHSHCTTGMAPMTYIMAVEAGGDIIDTAISAMSQGTSQPATEATVVALRGTPYDTGLSLRLLGEIAEHFRTVRGKYADFDSPVSSQIHADIMESQIPGGMFSNLVSQLRQQKAEDKLEAVLNEWQALFSGHYGDPELRDGAIRSAAGPGQRGDQAKGAGEKGAYKLSAGGSSQAWTGAGAKRDR